MILRLILQAIALLPMPEPVAAPRVRAAVMPAFEVLSTGAMRYPSKRDCFSCHHQTLPILASVEAKRRGLGSNEFTLQLQVRFTRETFSDDLATIRQGKSVPGASTMAAYALHTLQAAGYPRDEVTEALVEYLLVRQTKDGRWPALMPRVPSEGSSFTNNALSIQALRHYGRGDQVKRALAQGQRWLEQNVPGTTEDHVFRLRGLIVAGSEPRLIQQALGALLQLQRPNGAWAQEPGLPTDAYATGSALVALNEAGIKPDSFAYQAGVRWLLANQDQTGAWIVPTRIKPVQIYFDNGDPGGKNQFISMSATGWATQALLRCLPRE